MTRYILILVTIFFFLEKSSNENKKNNTFHTSNFQTDNKKIKKIHNYKNGLVENDKIIFFKESLKKFNDQRSFDTSFKKYSFPFIKKIKQKETNLVFYMFKNEYEDAMFGNSSYPFFIDDTKKRIIYYCSGDSLGINKTSFFQYINIRERSTKTCYRYNRSKMVFELN